jgi:hypothetical protein
MTIREKVNRIIVDSSCAIEMSRLYQERQECKT